MMTFDHPPRILFLYGSLRERSYSRLLAEEAARMMAGFGAEVRFFKSFNAVNTMRILGRWMRMFTIPNQSSVAKAFQEFNEDGTMKDSPYRDRVVDVIEELYKFTVLLRPQVDYLTDRYSERKEKAAKEVIAIANSALEVNAL